MMILIRALSWVANRWIVKQKKAFYRLGEPLSFEEKEALRPYFDLEVLEKTRKVFLDRIHPQDIPTKIRLSLLKTIFQTRKLAGLTLSDCVFLLAGLYSSNSQSAQSVLFHELVHVTQYRLLDTYGFIRRYFQSWADNGFSYHKISLERVACGLAHHYETFPGKPFSVSERVLAGFEIR